MKFANDQITETIAIKVADPGHRNRECVLIITVDPEAAVGGDSDGVKEGWKRILGGVSKDDLGCRSSDRRRLAAVRQTDDQIVDSVAIDISGLIDGITRRDLEAVGAVERSQINLSGSLPNLAKHDVGDTTQTFIVVARNYGEPIRKIST